MPRSWSLSAILHQKELGLFGEIVHSRNKAGKYTKNLEHLIVPERKEVLKE